MSDTNTSGKIIIADSSDKESRIKEIADAIKAGNKIDEILPESFSDILNGGFLEKYGIYTDGEIKPYQDGDDFTSFVPFVKSHKYVFYATGKPGYLFPITCFYAQNDRCSSKDYKNAIDARKPSENEPNQYFITVDDKNVFGHVWEITENEPKSTENEPKSTENEPKSSWKFWKNGGKKNKSNRKSNKKRKQQKSKKQRKSRK
jgi:hypothetical protein